MRKISKILLIIIGFACLSISCKKAKEIEYKKTWPLINEYIYNLMKDVYLYNDKVPTKTDMSIYETPSDALNALTYKTQDNWSFVENTKTMEDFYQNNMAVAYGFNIAWSSYGHDSSLIINYVANNSPAQKAGISRGCKIWAINKSNVIGIKNFYDFNPSSAGETIELGVTLLDGTKKSITLSATPITIETVPLYKIITGTNGNKYGYILINSFVNETPTKINEAFSLFSSMGATELIVDLRYNGGGLVDGAKYLANMSAPVSCNGKTMFSFIYNSNNTKYDQTVNFSKTNAQSFNHLFVLTTDNTASASELFLNIFKAYNNMKLVQIGQTSYGKPVGMNTFTYGDYAIVPITFATVNANREGYFYEGIKPDITVAEDFSKPLGDASEPFIAAALNYPGSAVTAVALKNDVIPHRDLSLRGKGFRSIINLY